MSSFAKVRRVRALETERELAKTDLYFLAKQLGYTLMTEEFHGELGAFLDSHVEAKEVAVFAPRSSYKTTLAIVWCLQTLLRNPKAMIHYIHHKLESSQAVVRRVGEHLLHHEWLRSIWPAEHLPNIKSKQWLKADYFTLPGIQGNQHPSLSAHSLGQNLTGDHPTHVVLDDLVNSDSLDEFGNSDAIRKWIEHTLTSILGVSGKARLFGTPWSDDDYHADIMKPESSWKYWLRAITEKDGVPCPLEDGGIPIPILVDPHDPRPLTAEDVLDLKRRSKRFFGSQFMMQPDRAGRRVWDPEKCEHYVGFEDIRHRIRKIFVLSDPAPLGVQDGPRRDGEKDDWAIAVVAAIVAQKRTVYVLLDGMADANWSFDAGLRRVRRMLDKWNTVLCGIEEPLGAGAKAKPFATRLKDICRQEALRLRSIHFKNVRMPKAYRFADFAALAECEDFLIADCVPPKFLEQFLDQARNWAGDHSLAHDDVLDCVSLCLDPAVTELLPKPILSAQANAQFGPLSSAVQQPSRGHYRYIRF